MNIRSGLALFLLMVGVVSGCAKESTSEVAVELSASPSAKSMGRAAPVADKIDKVKVQATGQGPTIQAAVDQAIRMAIEQVNGKTLDASATAFQGGIAVSIGSANVDIGSAAFASLVSTHSRGAVTDFKLLSQDKSFFKGEYTAVIEATVAKFVRKDDANRIRIAVVPFRTNTGAYLIDTQRVPAESVVRQLRTSITDTLTQTNRVTVLDREFSAELDEEMALIDSGKVAKEDFARVGQQLGTDYLVVGRIDRFEYQRHTRNLRTSDKTLVHHTGGGLITLRLINAATGQIEVAEKIAIELPETQPTTLGTNIDVAKIDVTKVTEGLANRLAGEASRRLALRLFPITVVAVDGDQLVLSQGGLALTQGAEYRVVLRAQEIKDPQTGQVLGRAEKACCTATITRITPELAYAKIASNEIDVAAAFAPGALEVREILKPDNKSSGNAAVAGAASKKKNDDFDDDFDSDKAKPDSKSDDSKW